MTVAERIESKMTKVAKAEELIAKKEAAIAKKEAAIAKAQNEDDACWLAFDIRSLNEDIVSKRKEIAKLEKEIAELSKLVAGDNAKRNAKEELAIQFADYIDRLADAWTKWDVEKKDEIEAFQSENGYDATVKKYKYSTYEYYRYGDKESFDKDNRKSALEMIWDMVQRAEKITGKVTDLSNVHVNGYLFEGYIEGETGRAYLHSILAGGYNIQKLHVRVLVREC